MERITFRMPEELLERFETVAEQQGHKDRSEALRRAAREFVAEHADEDPLDTQGARSWKQVQQRGDD